MMTRFFGSFATVVPLLLTAQKLDVHRTKEAVILLVEKHGDYLLHHCGQTPTYFMALYTTIHIIDIYIAAEP
jgi:hypothetical protein